MHNNRTFRILFDIGLFFSVLYLPWWASAVGIAVGIAVFRSFYESLAAAFLIDALYGRNAGSIIRTYPFSSVTSALFLISFWLKEHLRTDHF